MSGATCAAQNPTGTVLTPRPMHKVVWSDLIISVCPVVVVSFSWLSWFQNPFTQKVASTKSDRSSLAFIHDNASPARMPVSLPKKAALRPSARPPARPETLATDFHSLNPFIGTPLPIVGRRSEAVKQEMQARWHHATWRGGLTWECPFFLPPAGCAAMAQVRLVHSS